MATKLQCEICGGKLVGKPGGIFECEFCGTEFSTEWAKAKIQEIQGIVRVEGTVEVKGSVQIEGSANVQSLIRRGNLTLEDGKWDDAQKCFNDALNADPENAEAYLGIAMAKSKCRNKTDFSVRYLTSPEYKIPIEINRAYQFGNDEMKSWISDLKRKRASTKALLEKQKREEEAARKKKEEEEEAARKKKELEKQLEEQKIIKRLKEKREEIAPYQGLIAASFDHTIAVRSDGKVMAVGHNNTGQCSVSGWSDIKAVATAPYHSIALKVNGTVVATKCIGYNNCGQCDVSGWSDIIAVSTNTEHTVGLKSDGTVVATKYTQKRGYHGQSEVSWWSDVIAIAAGESHTVGLQSDGSLVVTKYPKEAIGGDFGQREVYDWSNIVAIASGQKHTVGLKSNGTVVAIGENKNGQCNVDDWTDIVAIAANGVHTVGLRSDGTVVAVGDNYTGRCNVESWTDIVAIAAGGNHTIGLRSDGTLVATGSNKYGQCNVSDWKLFKSKTDTEAEYASACALQASGTLDEVSKALAIFNGLRNYKDSPARAKSCYILLLNIEKNNLNAELPQLKGMFSGKRRKQIESRIAEIDYTLRTMK